MGFARCVAPQPRRLLNWVVRLFQELARQSSQSFGRVYLNLTDLEGRVVLSAVALAELGLGDAALSAPNAPAGEPVALSPGTLGPAAFATGVNDEGALSPQDARYLQILLEGLASPNGLTPAQLAELQTLAGRFNEHRLEVEGEEQLAQLGRLIDALQQVSEQVGPARAANQLDYINEMVSNITAGLEEVKAAEYEKFESLIGENKTRQQARAIVEETAAGFTG